MKLCIVDWCCVLFVGTILIWNVEAGVREQNDAVGECLGQYLKGKGKVEFDSTCDM